MTTAVPPPFGAPLPRRLAMGLDLASASVIAVVLALVLGTFRDYGVTWDETWHLVYGDLVLDWWTSLGADRGALCYRIDYMYGGGFDLLGAIVRRLSPMSDIETIHLLGALVGVLGLGGAWSLARRLGGPAAGLAAVVLLATTPVYYGHMFANPKDLPFAVGYVWAMDALCDVVLRLPRVPRRAWIRFAILAGLAMGVRVAGILLLVYLGAVVVGMAVLRARATRSAHAGLQLARRLAVPAAWSMLGAWVVMLSTWPWALLDPIRRPWMALGRMSRFTIHHREMPFAGQMMVTTEPRWDYLLHYFGLKLPLSVLLLLLGVVVVGGWSLRSRAARARLPRAQRNVALVLAAAILAPPTYAVVVRSVIYDGLRHFLFLAPVIVVVASLGVVVVPRALRGAARIASVVIAVAGSLLVARQIDAMRALHPYQYVYFNELIGGLAGATGNYDTDYYGASYKEGFRMVAETMWRTDRERFLDSRYVVTGCIPELVALYYIEGNLAWVDRGGRGAEFYVGYTRADCHELYGKRPEMFRVERQGALLLVGRDLRGVPLGPDEVPGRVGADP